MAFQLRCEFAPGDSVSWFSLPLSQRVPAKNVNCFLSQKACIPTLSVRVLSFLLWSFADLWGWLALAQGWMVPCHLWHPVSPSSLGRFGQIV